MTGHLNYQAVRARNAELGRAAEQYRSASAAGYRRGSARGRSVRRWKLHRRWRLGLKPVPVVAKASRK